MYSRRSVCNRPSFRSGPLQGFVVASVKGWAETRQLLPQLERIRNDPDGPRLPGTHFAEPPPITADDLLRIIHGDTPDEWVNEIVRNLLGWRLLENGEWNDDFVAGPWKKIYPDGPPDFIGKNGDYTPETDRPVRNAIVRLTRTIPQEHKPILKEVLRPLGFTGWKLDQLTPNRTRRATAVNWILYWYRVHFPEYQWYDPAELDQVSKSS